jgi:hypothetical protein
MKKNIQNRGSVSAWRSIVNGLVLIGLLAELASRTYAADGKTRDDVIAPDDIVASVNIIPLGNTNVDVSHAFLTWDRLESKWESQQIDLVWRLVAVLNDPRSPDLNKCVAAYYLAGLRCEKAVTALAANIKLQYDEQFASPPHSFPKMLPGEHISADALVGIGNPSIPAMIRKLSESDDAKVRELSLQVLTRIDGDKDISQLRLQKALKAETDSEKQARLQAALKALAETK